MCCFHFNTLFIENDKIVIPRKDVRHWASVFHVNHKLFDAYYTVDGSSL